jgi:3-oxoacyl-[acyl-carrier protein] reductase
MNERPEVALVTGAGSPDGIGFAVARRLAERGAAVVITSTTLRIHDRVATLRAAGGEVIGVVADLTDPAAADRLVEHATSEFGGLDVLVNNAGLASVLDPDRAASVADIADDDWHRALARNLDTAFFLIRAALVPMRASGYGRIVNVASVSGPLLAYRGDAGYHAAKAALVGLTRSAAVDVAGDGITVNAVAPGWIATGSSTDHELRMGAATPLGRPGTPDEVAGLVAYLATRDAGYLTGQVIVVDGGNSIMEERAP